MAPPCVCARQEKEETTVEETTERKRNIGISLLREQLEEGPADDWTAPSAACNPPWVGHTVLPILTEDVFHNADVAVTLRSLRWPEVNPCT
ncbi:hypothetical protein EYF80_065383 [Liparis tanakae]|uniref:Uncharacterized protein n=1 Tax=Liparis tanakae TaxID=230148 RepID=A0A4Z2E6V8_9TELE|nr:hypothetical protein EYF80_065383 [Liparis tanakae]